MTATDPNAQATNHLGKRGLSMSLDSWSLFSNAAFFVLSALALIAGITVFLVARAESKQKDRELSRYQSAADVEIAKANAEAATARRETADLSVQLEQEKNNNAQRFDASANRQSKAEADLAVDKEKSAVREVLFSDDDSHRLLEFKSAKVTILGDAANPEVNTVLRSFSRSLSKYLTVDTGMVLGPSPTNLAAIPGIHLIKTASLQSNGLAAAIRSILERNHLQTDESVSSGVIPAAVGSDLQIIIGPKSKG